MTESVTTQQNKEAPQLPSVHDIVDILLAWRNGVVGLGYEVPPDQDLRTVVDAYPEWPSGRVGSEAEAWKDTLIQILKQCATGAADPISTLPTQLMAPSQLATEDPDDTAASETPGRGSDVRRHYRWARRNQEDAAVTERLPYAEGSAAARDYEALVAWRDGLSARDPHAGRELNNSYLKQIVAKAKVGGRSAEEITISARMRPYANEIAAVLKDAQDGGLVHAEQPLPVRPVPSTPGQVKTESVVGDTAAMAESGAAWPSRDGGTRSAEATGLESYGFAPYSFSQAEREPVTLRALASPSGGVTVSWPEYNDDPEGNVVIYRVIADDYDPLYSPDRGDVVAAVLGLTAEDHRPLTSAQRYFQVWCNSGPTIETARAAQPRLHAQDLIVCPVNDFELREDSGRVIGEWTVWPGVLRVQVFRIPIEIGARGAGDLKYRILADEDNVGGFVDADTERGRRYVYLALAEIDSSGVIRLSTPVGRDVLVSVVLQPVTDLIIEQHGGDDDPQFDLSWSPPPAGNVVVFRTKEAPLAGVEDREEAESALDLANLRPDDRLRHPVSALPGGRSGMRNVPWPKDWAMAYFTPVTILDGRAYVGAWQSSVRVGTIRDAVLRERVDEQVLTFSWPPGADSVYVHVAPLGMGSAAATQSEAHEISRDHYVQEGGLRLPFPLPSERGCSLHLVPSAFQRGVRHDGTTARVDYPGLLRIRYQTIIRRQRVRNKAISVTVTITAERDVLVAPGFALICNKDRMPLHIDDGFPLSVTRVDDEQGAPGLRILPRRLGPVVQEPGWIAGLEKGPWLDSESAFFVRLFADLPPEALVRVAVLDPPIADLRIR